MKFTNEQKLAVEALPKLARAVVLERLKDAQCSDVECYRRAGGLAQSESAMRNSVHKILTNTNTVKVINMFKTDEPLNKAIMTREQMLEDLTNVVNVQVSDVMSWTTCVGDMIDSQTGDVSQYPSIITVKNMDEIPPHVMKCIKSVEQTKSGMIKLTMEDRAQARKLLADMQGFMAPIVTANVTKHVDTDEDFTDALKDMGIDF